MSSKVQLIGGAFQDPAGNALANGYLLMSLSQDGSVNGGSQIAAGVELKITLDTGGNVDVTTAQSVWPNDAISPANTFYMVSAYTAQGQLVWGPNPQQVFSTPSPFPLGSWVPQSVSTNSQPIVTYDIGAFYPGFPYASTIFTLVPLERTVRFGANLAPSTAACGTAPTGTVVFPIYKNGTQFATLTFNAGSKVGVFASTNGATFVAGDVLTINTPSSSDATLSDVGMILSGVAPQ